MILKFLAQISMTLIREDIYICFGRCEIEHKKNNKKRAKQCAYHIMLTQWVIYLILTKINVNKPQESFTLRISSSSYGNFFLYISPLGCPFTPNYNIRHSRGWGVIVFLILSLEIHIICPNRVKSKTADLFPVNLEKTKQLNSM